MKVFFPLSACRFFLSAPRPISFSSKASCPLFSETRNLFEARRPSFSFPLRRAFCHFFGVGSFSTLSSRNDPPPFRPRMHGRPLVSGPSSLSLHEPSHPFFFPFFYVFVAPLPGIVPFPHWNTRAGRSLPPSSETLSLFPVLGLFLSRMCLF